MVSLQGNSREEGVCPICLTSPREAVSTDCGHLFCRPCLAQHVEKAAASGVFCCPLCRKPCSEGVLGTGHVCRSHQKKLGWFCEENRLLLCTDCLASPEHKSHRELTVEDAISHYKERLYRRSRKLRKDIGDLQRLTAQEAVQFQVDGGSRRLEAQQGGQHQTEKQLSTLGQQRRPGHPEDMLAEALSVLTQLSSLVTDLERTAKTLGASTLKNARDLLARSDPQTSEAIHPTLQRRINDLLPQPPAATPTHSALGRLASDPPQPSRSPSPDP
ncbi:E3 ubiquitin ligase TRIM40 isoform X1 [Saccopteryx leptura]|uniref:E3 ubiquitin ligase TRIM40 isoform X1 n=1 Tax=Saccopteryx leptura TaxID=249018 RepID=UPI00339CC8F2